MIIKYSCLETKSQIVTTDPFEMHICAFESNREIR